MRRAARVDDNQAAVVAALRKAGISVRSLAAVGDGVPDLLCGFRGRNVLLEVKDGSKPASDQRLTAREFDFFATWCGCAYIATSPENAVKIVLAATA